MQPLTPKSIEVDCVYQCPSCHAQHWYTLKELKGRKTLQCVCGEEWVIATVTEVKVLYEDGVERKQGSGGIAKVKSIQASTPTPPQLNAFITTLVNLGLQRGQARKLVETHTPKYTGDDEEFLGILLDNLKE